MFFWARPVRGGRDLVPQRGQPSSMRACDWPQPLMGRAVFPAGPRHRVDRCFRPKQKSLFPTRARPVRVGGPQAPALFLGIISAWRPWSSPLLLNAKYNMSRCSVTQEKQIDDDQQSSLFPGPCLRRSWPLRAAGEAGKPAAHSALGTAVVVGTQRPQLSRRL